MKELTHIIDLLQRAHDTASIRVLAKTYHIGWVTLSDVLAGLLNEVFDLGYADRDVSLSGVLRNKHVRDRELDKVVAKHAQAVQFDRFRKLRNDVVHRGMFDDADLAALENDESGLALRAAVDTHSSERAVLESAILQALHDSGWTQRVTDFTNRRADELREHVQKTAAMLTELDAILADYLTSAV